MSNLKTVLREVVKEQLDKVTSPVALLLSGGIDSRTIALTLSNLGVSTRAYTFRIDNQDTVDIYTAQNTANKLGINWSLIDISSESLEKDFLELASKWKCRKKTEFECTFPFIHLFPKINEEVVLAGTTADTLYGSSKKVAMHFARPKEVFDLFRKQSLEEANIEGYKQLQSVALEYNKKLILPYRHQKMQDFFMSKSYDELHAGTRKSLAKADFGVEFTQLGKVNSRNLQLAANIPSIFERLLVSPLNKRNRTRVMDLCRDYAE